MARTPEEALQTLLGQLKGVKSGKPVPGKTSAQWTACCPTHEDRSASLSIGVSSIDGRILVRCHSTQGCTASGIAGTVGLSESDLSPLREDRDEKKSPRGHFDLAMLARAKALPLKYLQDLGVTNAGGNKVEIEYRTADGQRAPRHRLRIALTGPDRFKWAGEDGGEVIPYGVDRLEVARADGTLKDYLVLVEGESDCWAGWYHGIQVLGIPGSKMVATLKAEHLAGISRVLVIKEPDDGGSTFAKGIGERLAALKFSGEAKEVSLPVKDLSDLHIKFGGDSDAVVKSFREAVARGSKLGVKPRFRVMSSAEFDDTDFAQRFLIDRILVEGQAAICGGRSKTLKTTLMVDLALSIGGGVPFLGKFDSERSNVWMMSGESGGFTLKETARRICKSKGIRLRDTSVDWGFDLPQLGSPTDIEELRREVEVRKTKVLIIDPAYLCLLAGAATGGLQVSNLFHTGPLLLGISRLGIETGCTVILCHHCKKGGTGGAAFKNTDNQAPELEDLAMAGFAEWARQWLLLGRREAFEPGTGHHKLWLNVGGSAGHSGCWAVDADEGSIDSNFGGRRWDVNVIGLGEAKEDQERSRERKKSEKAQRTVDTRVQTVRDTLRIICEQDPGFVSKRRLCTDSGLNNDNVTQALETLRSRGELATSNVKDGKTSYLGYRLVNPNGTKLATFVPGDAFEEDPADIDISAAAAFFTDQS